LIAFEIARYHVVDRDWIIIDLDLYFYHHSLETLYLIQSVGLFDSHVTTIKILFLDFIKPVDQNYDHSIKQIFLVLDNISIHKSNKIKENLARQVPSKNTISISSNKIS
jgi:hypothetical protein